MAKIVQMVGPSSLNVVEFSQNETEETMRYRTKPVKPEEVEAIQYVKLEGSESGNLNACFDFIKEYIEGDVVAVYEDGDLFIQIDNTPLGDKPLRPDYWLIKIIDDGEWIGGIFVVDSATFDKTYEPIPEDTETAEPTICPGCGMVIERIMDVVDHYKCFGLPANPESVVKPAPPPPKPPKTLTADEQKAKEKAEALQKEAVTRRYGVAT